MESPVLRFAIPADLPSVVGIDALSEDPASLEQWGRYFTRRRFRIIVIVNRRRIDAACVLRLRSDAIFIERLIAHQDFTESLAASMFLDQLCSSITAGKRLVLQIDEYDLDWQQFLKARGFRATANIRGAIEVGEEKHDAIQLEYGHDLAAEKTE